VEGEKRKIECGSVGAVRDNMPTFIQRKRKYNEPQVQSAVPVHPYVKGKVVAMGSGLLDYTTERRIWGEFLV